jgi:hypothetical protein
MIEVALYTFWSRQIGETTRPEVNFLQVCVCVRERVCERKSVCVRDIEREFVCVCDRERERDPKPETGFGANPSTFGVKKISQPE